MGASVQVHLRHLVGGRARSYMGSLPHEKIIQASKLHLRGHIPDAWSDVKNA